MYLVPRILRNRGVKVQDDTKQIEEVMAKRTAKNSVFLDLFQNKSYLLKLYKTLHPEDTTATEDSLTDIIIENVLTDNLYNDLGFVEVKMPKPELYVIFTGNKGRKTDKISLSKEFFEGADIDIEVKAKVIYESDTDDIINQYIIFCKVFNEQTKQHGMTQKAVTERFAYVKTGMF